MSELRLERKFYSQDTVQVAQKLLGKILVRKINDKTISGIITETEAYRQADDPASHAYKNITARNSAMFGQVGHAYVYFTYGMHYCVNAVARNKEHSAGAVLIRSLKPLEGIDIMIKNRKIKNLKELTNGPAKITMALNITKEQYGEDLVNSESLYITHGIRVKKIISNQRIGIKTALDKLWNFKIKI